MVYITGVQKNYMSPTTRRWK